MDGLQPPFSGALAIKPMKYTVIQASDIDGPELAELRVVAMKPSLEAVGRFDPNRARERFISGFSSLSTWKILINNQTVGFYTYELKEDHIWLSHLYLHPERQNLGVGGRVLDQIKSMAAKHNCPVRLGALKQSRSNDFYIKHGFKRTHDEEWDIYLSLIHI